MLTVLDDCSVSTIPLYEGDLDYDLGEIANRTHALDVVGGLSKPGKMPCWSYNLPASRCKAGGRLSKVPGSVCYGCYAADTFDWAKQRSEANGAWSLNRYTTPQVLKALERRYSALFHPLWVPAMIFLIRWYARDNRGRKGVKYFRWHDSGDVQDENHFQNIMLVASNTPDIKHWLPTREYSIVTEFSHPENLCVRLSAHMVDGEAPVNYGLPTGTVSSSDEGGSDRCPAPSQGGICGSCRRCWDKSVPNVDYHKHA